MYSPLKILIILIYNKLSMMNNQKIPNFTIIKQIT